MPTNLGRWTTSSIAAAVLLVATVGGGVASEAPADHEVVGRFSVTSDAGGAVWAFQPGGLLVVTGPGDIISEGSWKAASGEREFDAKVDYEIAGQLLDVLGQVSPDGEHVALYVSASEAQRPGDADPWPAVSRLIGDRLGMIAEATPSPSPIPADCARPEWVEGSVDWDRCDDTLLTAA